MATSLARQLQSLAAPSTDTFLHQGRKKASLLFDPAEAANYDIKDIYGIGLAGLQELQLLPGAGGEAFTRLETVLFGEVSQTVERSVRSAELNKQLDAAIEEFLRAVSPYLMLGVSLKCLEWLVVRFHIHQYNIDAVMTAFLPYHETKIFVRMVQLLEFQFNKKWEFLTAIQKKGVVLTKKDLLKYLSKEGWLQGFLCEEMIRRADDRLPEARPAGEAPVGKSSNDVFCKFFASTFLALLYEVKEIDNPLIARILPCMAKCLQSQGRDYRLSAYAVLATLGQRIKLKEETNKLLAMAMGESITKYGDENGMKALSVILTAQERQSIPEKVFSLFAEREFFTLAVRTINRAKLTDFLWIVFTTAVEMVFQTGNPSAESVVDFIGSFIKKIQLDDATKAKLVKFVVEKTLDSKEDLTQIDLPLGRCLAKMRDLDPATWSSLLNAHGTAHDHLLERLDLTFIQSSDAVCLTSTSPTTSLFLRLNHPNTALRIAASKELIGTKPTEEVSGEFLADMVRDRLEDSDPGVVVGLLADPQALGKIVSAEALKELMVRLLCRLDGKEKRERWNAVEAAAVAVLANVGEVQEVLPFLVGALFRRNQHLLAAGGSVGELFPKCLVSLKDKSVLSKLLEDAVDDFTTRSGDSIFPAIKTLTALLDRPDFPTGTALGAVTVLVEVVSRLNLFFPSSEACGILDCVCALVARVKLTDRVLTEEQLEQSLNHVRKGKLSGAVVLGWCTLLWDNMQFDAKTNPDALLRAAKFVLADMEGARDVAFRQALVVVFVCSVLKEPRALAALLTAIVSRQESKSSFIRNALSLTAEALSVMPKECLEDSVVGEILSVAIPAMRHEDPRMRQGGLQLLQNLKTKRTFRSMEAEDLLVLILAGRDQIELDELAIAQILGNAFTEKSSGERKKTFWLDLLLQPVQSASDLIRLNVLIALRQVQPFAVFLKLHPMIDRLLSDYRTLESPLEVRILNECLGRLSPQTSGARFPLATEVESKVLEVMMRALSLPARFDLESPADVVLRQMFFMSHEQLGEDVYNQILQEILRIYVEKSNPTSHTAFRKYLKHVRIPGKLIIAQLNEQTVVQKKRMSTQGLARLNNPRRKTHAFWHRVGSLLDVIQTKKKVSDVNLLIKELFDLAKETVVLDQNPELAEELENVRRLIFGTINFHCKRSQAEKKEGDTQDSLVVDASVFDVSAIVDVIRSSTDSQTHLSALVLLSTLATVMPAQVLQNCMTIFTLSGTKLLHKDDQYSVEVFGRTIDVLVPVMLQANGAGTGHQANTVRAVLELFIDALPHMPVQRRQFLFQRVLKVADGPDNLWILIVLLMNIYVAKELPVEEEDVVRRRSYPVLCEFLEQLCEGMPLDGQVKNFQQATEYILSISAAAAVAKTGSQTTVSQPKKRKTITSAFDKPLINANFTAAEHIRLITAMVTFVGYQIPSHAFRTTYQQQQQQAHAAAHVAAEESAAAALDRCLEQLLVSLLDIQSRARLQTRTSGKSAADTPAWAELLKRTSVAVTEILGQMSWSSFVTIMLGILRDTTPVMVKTALEELGGTLSLRAAITKADVPHLVPLIGALVGILESQMATKDLTAEGAGVQRGCLFCLKQLAGILGNHSAETWTTILSTGVKFLASSDISIRCEAISCLTTVIVTVKTSVLPRLPEFLPGLLEHVHQLLSGKAQDTASLLTAIDALEAIVSILTAFISPQLPKILAIVAQCATKTVQPTLKDSFSGKVVRIRGILCGDVPFRVMFGAFKETYGALRQTEVFSIFNDSLKKARTGDILSMQREIVDFLFTVFDTREDLPSALDALSLVALRMPESSFKGLFMKLYQWATQDGLQRKKLLTFYQIVERLTDALKHLFIIYAANVVSHAVTIMSAFHVEKSAGSISESDRQTETDVLITILDVLTRFFKYDTTGYFNADQCDVLNQPLVDQLDNYREPESYKRLVEHLIPAITGFSVCLNDDSLWKPLHYQVLLKTRHDEAAVRVAALQSIESLVESMGESYSNLLPEAVTFLVELSAEDDELVEAQCARTKATIEKVLGDSSIWRNAVE